MGLSIVISGAIIMIAIMFVLFNLPVLMDTIISVEETSSKISKVELIISRTDIEITSTLASSGNDLVSFELLNKGNEKLWNWDKFDLLITYDADTGGASPTRITEKITYNNVGLGLIPDFNIQRGFVDFGAGEDVTTANITPVRSFGDGGFAFVRLTNTQHASSGETGVNVNIDDIGIFVEITASDTITFTRQASGRNFDYRVAYEVWEYIGPPGGPNEFIVRLKAQPATIGQTAVDTLVPNVVDREKLVPFISSLIGSATNNNWDDMTHTAEIIDDGFGNTFVRVQRDGTDTRPSTIVLSVVEFTGSNWIVQNNISHPFVAGGVDETETVATNADFEQAVNSWNEAFIFSSYHAANVEEEAEEVGYVVRPDVTTDSIRFRINGGANNVDSDYLAIVHVVENPDMSVIHEDSITGGGADFTGGGGDPDIENKVFAPPIANPTGDEAALISTAETPQGGAAIPRIFWDYRLIADDTVEYRRGNDGGSGQWALQVIEFPQFDSPLTSTFWSVFNIKNDYLDSGILNNQETAQITAQLSNPIFADGLLILQISTDNGIQATNSQIVT